MSIDPEIFICKDNGVFPNSMLPVLQYKAVLDITYFFPARSIRELFNQNKWFNSWNSGIFTYHHYHSNTHEVMGVYAGSTTILLGGDNGHQIKLGKGDVLVIPAGVAHKNLGRENQVRCIGAYPDGRTYDIKHGHTGERPGTDRNIATVPIPTEDPVFGVDAGLSLIWPSMTRLLPFSRY